MHTLTFKTVDSDERYPEDIDRIVKACAEAGYEISRQDAQRAWEAYSDSMCAGWMNLPDADSWIVSEVLMHCI